MPPHQPLTPPNWLTVQQLATHYGVTPETIRRWAAADKIRHLRLPSGRLRFPLDAIELSA